MAYSRASAPADGSGGGAGTWRATVSEQRPGPRRSARSRPRSTWAPIWVPPTRPRTRCAGRSPSRCRPTGTARRGSSRWPTRRAASARPRRPSTWVRRWPSTAARCCWSTSTRRARCSVGLGVNPHNLDLSIYNLLMQDDVTAEDVAHQDRRRRACTCCRPTSTCPRPRSSWSTRWPGRWRWPGCCARSARSTTSS